MDVPLPLEFPEKNAKFKNAETLTNKMVFITKDMIIYIKKYQRTILKMTKNYNMWVCQVHKIQGQSVGINCIFIYKQ